MTTMLCIVCEQETSEDNVASGIRPGDWVICKDCDKITPNRKQAVAHWEKHYAQSVQHKKNIEAALTGAIVIPQSVTQALIKLTDLYRDAKKQGIVTPAFRAEVLTPVEAEIERHTPGYVVAWNPAIEAYGIFPGDRCP